MKALCTYAGPRPRQHIAQRGLRAQDSLVVPAAEGGPKGLILGPLDRFIFGDWLARSTHEVRLEGASIGARCMATSCLDDPVEAFARLEHDSFTRTSDCNPAKSGRQSPMSARYSGETCRSLSVAGWARC